MNVGSALLAGNDASPQLAVEALARALERTGQSQASGVLLFLTADFARQAQQTVTAVARAARCTEVAGGVAAGVFTDGGWVLDRPAVAAMAFTDGLAFGRRETPDGAAGTILSYAGSNFPPAWFTGNRRFGGSFSGPAGFAEPLAWQQSRTSGECNVHFASGRVEVGLSRGWRFLGTAHSIELASAYALLRVEGRLALASLMSDVAESGDLAVRPPALTSLCAVLLNPGDPLPQAGELLADAHRPVPLVDCGSDDSLTLAERIQPRQSVAWAMRSPEAASTDMQRSIRRLAAIAPAPVAAMIFSCIGRGPYFYGGEDQDLDCLRERFPHLPLIGTYGTGQIAPDPAGGNRLLHNAVVTALISH